MFEKSLHDLVKGIRNAKADLPTYIAKCIQEIKDELKSRDILIKAQALQKMLYLNMLGHEMSWAAFHIIEVMSQERFGLKRIGFQACAQTFTPATDVIVLCTQLLKKEFSAKSPYEIGQAINCLANVATEDLSRDLLGDVTTMLTSSRPYIRKKATLVLYKLYLQYPQGLRLTFDNLKRRLTDDNVSVVSCAVNVICELARKKPSNYLSLAPDLFALLTTSSNNWMLIKVAKLMSALVQEEPRLARKLLEPLATIVQTTPAKSLMYECISTITYALMHTKKSDGTDAKNAPAVVRLCTDKLREMVREPDQNLKYLGLSGLMNLMRSNPRVVAEHRELVLQCLVDEDVTIRLRALELITGMVTRRNLQDIVKRLLELLEGAEGHWRDELIAKIVFMCSRDKYAYLTDFAWYVSVLARLAYIHGSRHCGIVAGQLLDVAVRVEDVRPYAVQALLPMLADSTLAANARMHSAAAASTAASGSTPAAVPAGTEGGSTLDDLLSEGIGATAGSMGGAAGASGSGQVLYAAAWIVGEYCAIIPPAMHSAVIDALLQPGTLTLPPAVQGVYIQAALKMVAAAAGSMAKDASISTAPFVALASSVLDRLNPFARSVHVEVQERACLVQQLLASLGVPYTPPPTPSSPSSSAATKKAEDELLALATGGAAASSTATTAAPAPLPPLDLDVRLVAAVLGSLFSETLKPVNPKAQKKVPLPPGINLDKWLSPEEEKAQAAEISGSSASAAGRSGFKYESISFEDSYGVAEEEASGAGGMDRSAGSAVRIAVGGGTDEDDEAWFRGLEKANKKRDKELWGDNSPVPTGSGRRKGGASSSAGEGAAGFNSGDKAGITAGSGRRKGGTAASSSDPFYLKASSSSGPAHGADDDVDSIPIAKLDGDALGLKSALDISIFGDFGGKGKKGGDKKDGKGKKGGKKAKGGDDEEDDGEYAGASGKGGRSFKVADDDDMPYGAGDDSDEDGGVRATADALASVDLSTPLRDDEVLPSKTHRTVGGTGVAATGKGRGRARVLGAEGGAGGSGDPEEVAGSGKKGSKKDKGDKKADKEGKKSKKDKGEDQGEAAATATGKKSKKDKAAAAESAAPAPAPAPVVVPAKQGEEYAAAPPHSFPLAADKTVKVSYSITLQLPSTGAAGGAGASARASAAGPLAVVTLRVDPKSSKKTVDWVDLAFADASAPVVKSSIATPGASAGSARLASALKEKLKGKKRWQASTLQLAVTEPAATASFPVRITYQVTGAAAPTTIDTRLSLFAAAVLVPTQLEQEAYRTLMTTDGASFTNNATGAFPIPAGDSAEGVINAICGVLRGYAVARSPQHALVYARTTAGAHVTALLKADDAGTAVSATVRCVVPGHAAIIVDNVTEALKDKLAAAGEGADE